MTERFPVWKQARSEAASSFVIAKQAFGFASEEFRLLPSLGSSGILERIGIAKLALKAFVPSSSCVRVCTQTETVSPS